MSKVFSRVLLFQLWVVTSGVNFSRLIELSRHVRQQEDIRSLVVYSERGFVESLSEFDMFLRHQSSEIPIVLIKENYESTESLNALLGSWSIAFVFMDTVDSPSMFTVVNQTLRQIHFTKIIFIVRTLSEERERLIRFFTSCLRLGMVNVIVVADQQVLSYEPFPVVSLENITLTSMDKYFPDRIRNLKGYTFYSPIQQDAQRVFIPNDTDDVSQVTGVGIEIFRVFAHRHNATFDKFRNLTSQKSFDISLALDLLLAKKMDILFHEYSYFDSDLFAWSYPIAQVQWWLMVPYVGEVSTFMYLILPFDQIVWVCLGASVVYTYLMTYITLRFLRQATSYGTALSRVLLNFLYIPGATVPCNLQGIVFDLQIIAYGFILTNLYLAFLSAFLTTTVQGQQIDSLKQLLQSGIKILTSEFEQTLIITSHVFERVQYDGVFKIEPVDFVYEYRRSMNKTYAFVMADDRSRFFLGQQKYLKHKRMHISKESLGTYFITFTMQMDSPFQKDFDTILLALYQTGLYKKWEEDVFNLAVATKYLNIFRAEEDDGFKPLSASFLLLCWLSYGVGISLGITVLLVEVVRFRMAKK